MKKRLFPVICLILSLLILLGNAGAVSSLPISVTMNGQIFAQVREVGSACLSDKDREVLNYPYAYEVKFFDLQGNEVQNPSKPVSVYLPYEIVVPSQVGNHQLMGDAINKPFEEKIVPLNPDNMAAFLVSGGKETQFDSRYIPDLKSVKLVTATPGVYAVKDAANTLLDFDEFADGSDYALSMIAKGIIKGDGKYLLGKQCITRAQFVTLIVRALGLDIPNITESSFSDVGESNYFLKEIEAAKNVGILDVSSGAFNPYGTVKKVDAAIILNNAIEKFVKGKALLEPDYTDISNYPAEIQNDIINVASYLVIEPFGEYFNGGQDITREEAAAMIGKFYYLSKRPEAIEYPIDGALSPSSFAGERANGVYSYPAISTTVKSDCFELSANGVPVFVNKSVGHGIARLEISGKTDFVVTASKDIKDIKISPWSKGITAKVSGNKAYFTLNSAQNLLVEVAGVGKLMILADPPEGDKPVVNGTSVVDVTTINGVDKTGKADSTAAINNLFKSINGQNKTVYFPAGVYTVSPLFPKNDTTIYLEAGATISGMNDASHFTNESFSAGSSGLITLYQVKNVRIMGHGVLYGDGITKRITDNSFGPRNIMMLSASNVEISNILSLNPGSWNTHIRNCDTIAIDNYRILNEERLAWTDGIDVDSSKNVSIGGAFVYSGDDSLSVKNVGWCGPDYDNVDNVLAQNCIFYSSSAAFKLGTETEADYIRNVTVKNCDYLKGDRILQIFIAHNALVSDIHFEDIRVEKVQGDQQNKLITLRVRDDSGQPVLNGRADGIYFNNIRSHKPSIGGSEVGGYSEKNYIKNVLFENIFIAGKKITNFDDFNMSIKDFTENIVIK